MSNLKYCHRIKYSNSLMNVQLHMYCIILGIFHTICDIAIKGY